MTGLDYVLLAALLLLVPGKALWRTRPSRSVPEASRSSRYVRSLILIGALLAWLLLIWSIEGRSVALLGLDMPVSRVGLIGIAISAAILILLAAILLLKRSSAGESPPPPGADRLPQTRQETILFLLFALAAGIGWELLYRGYLLWALTPQIGAVAAVIVAAAAYGLAHGASDRTSLIGAIVSSFLFTIAYALTGSLWWLILLHSGLPLIGLLAGRISRSAQR